MEDILKLKVWDILGKRMLEWEDIMHLPAWEIFPGTPEQRAYIIMQCTGKKDKNGILIYEGSVIQDSKYNLTGTVVWNDSLALFAVNWKQGGYDKMFDIPSLQSIEVLGTIYTHPELLKED